jgi:hypothetical protein
MGQWPPLESRGRSKSGVFFDAGRFTPESQSPVEESRVKDNHASASVGLWAQERMIQPVFGGPDIPTLPHTSWRE